MSLVVGLAVPGVPGRDRWRSRSAITSRACSISPVAQADGRRDHGRGRGVDRSRDRRVRIGHRRAGGRTVQRRAHDRAAWRRLPIPRQAVQRRIRGATARVARAGRRPNCGPGAHARTDDARDRPVDDLGAAEYKFYLERTSAAELTSADVPSEILDGSNAIALGGLGLLVEPTASTLTALIQQRPPGATILLDPNCRPAAVTDLPAYRETIDTTCARSTSSR